MHVHATCGLHAGALTQGPRPPGPDCCTRPQLLHLLGGVVAVQADRHGRLDGEAQHPHVHHLLNLNLLRQVLLVVELHLGAPDLLGRLQAGEARVGRGGRAGRAGR